MGNTNLLGTDITLTSFTMVSGHGHRYLHFSSLVSLVVYTL